MNLYVLKDKKANTVSSPFSAASDGVAMRYVMDSLSDGQSMVSRWPADFLVYHVGEYADDDGTLSPAAEVRLVIDVGVLAESRKGG